MKSFNRWMVISAVSIIGMTLVAFGSFAMGGTVSNAPLPLNSPSGVGYTMPENLPGRTGGPFLSIQEVKAIALDVAKARGELSPNIKNIILTTHGSLIEEGVFSPSYSVGNDREVYLVTLGGEFRFARVRRGFDPIKASHVNIDHVNIEIDATTGDVLAVGTSTLTKSEAVLQRLNLIR